MDAEQHLALDMANLAAEFDRQAVFAETMRASITAQIGHPGDATTFRWCAQQLRDRLEKHRSGPAWTVRTGMPLEECWVEIPLPPEDHR